MCWKYTGDKNMIGDIVIDDISIAEGLSHKQFLEYIKKKTDEAEELGITIDEHLKELAKNLSKKSLRYKKVYIGRELQSLVDEVKAFKLHGRIGKQTVGKVNREVDRLIIESSPTRLDKLVMVSGMTYQSGNKISKTFVRPNFLKGEIGKKTDSLKYVDGSGKPSAFQLFLDKLHPTLKSRFNTHLDEFEKGINAIPKDIKRAAIAGTHGEIRALDDLLKEIDPLGKLGDKVFNDIIGYNRFLRMGANKVQPPCAHCFYLADLVTFIGL
ncbi:hypothetical protein [uncultured Psychroserpens sp.]|uniref:hypothetical protein n=1 Tax=uncultured Psychroserpens sp. TaxID=255436 RepID=UPI00261274EE|nr:hypothetical protein [uncultured Psychroserpens sp.]